MLARDDLFARLAEGAAGVTVVTPNRRLAQALIAEFDEHQSRRGQSVWDAPDIVPLDAFVERLWEDALHSPLGGRLPFLLSGAQEQAIWEEIVGESALLSVSQTARLCREAWRLLHAWRIPPDGDGGEDAAAFRHWAKKYAARTGAEVDAARLPDLVASLLEQIEHPRLVVAYAFDILPPQSREFLARFEHAHCKPDDRDGKAMRHAFGSAREELESAAAWARRRLEEGRRRIGVVVPDLARRRKEVLRVFSRVLQPGFNLPGASRNAQPFNVSLGEPLADCPLVDCALRVLRFAFEEIPAAEASRLIRSPFLGEAETEVACRVRLDVQARQRLGARVSLPRLIALSDRAPLLRKRLERVFALRRDELRTAGEWARHFSAILDAAGFPGERTLDSAEFQAHAKWHEVLAELASLEQVSRPLRASQALDALRRLCSDTLFQPESGHAPIQILGVLESTGLRFDCLWVSGLTDEAWPMRARPNPFLPIALQRRAGIPEAAPESALALDRRITEDWKAAAEEVIFSHPLREGDRTLSPSPLIAHLEQREADVPNYPRYRDRIFAAAELVAIEDSSRVPALPGKVHGGTRVLADQAACPFRAFARWRLAAHALEAASPGPDAAARGRMLHALMREIWSELKSSAALRSMPLAPVIARAARAAVSEAGLDGPFAELERARLEKLAAEWLELEKRRQDFEVVALEEPRVIELEALEFASRIDRLDRLPGGEHVLIDYKTGARVTPKDWEPPRPDDPQLPLYAATAAEPLGAVAFARVRRGAMRFMGFSRDEEVIPGVKRYHDWPALLASWRREARALGAGFAAGEPRVDPKRGLKTCERCDLQPLCRVYEKLNVLECEEDGLE